MEYCIVETCILLINIDCQVNAKTAEERSNMNYISRKMNGLKRHITLVDRCLLFYLMILLLYMIIDLFIETDFPDTNTIDIIIRTSAAVIIGYFLSGNFVKTSNKKKHRIEDGTQKKEEQEGCFIAEKEGFNEKGTCNPIQVIIVACIGGISLILLFIVRNYANDSPEISATVSQFRDFVSACVGYLVSCGKSEK